MNPADTAPGETFWEPKAVDPRPLEAPPCGRLSEEHGRISHAV